MRAGEMIKFSDNPHLTPPCSSPANPVDVDWGKFLAKSSPGEQRLVEHLRNSALPEIAREEDVNHVIEWLKVDLSFGVCFAFFVFISPCYSR
jgi:hypothetical protein